MVAPRALLTALFTRLQDAEYMIVVSFLIFVVLDVELLTILFKIEARSTRLDVFYLLCLSLLPAVALYLFAYYAFTLQIFLVPFLPLLFGGVAIALVRRLKTARKAVHYLVAAILGLFTGIIATQLIMTFLL